LPQGHTQSEVTGVLMTGVSEHPLSNYHTPSPPQPRFYFVKHPLQNTENVCHQWLSGSIGVHQIRFGRGSDLQKFTLQTRIEKGKAVILSLAS